MNITPTFRKFHLQRHEDTSGVSGLGRIAEGIVFSDGTTVVRWLSACGSTNVYANSEGVKQVHGHGGNTELVWDDPDPAPGDNSAEDEGLNKILDDPESCKKIVAVAEAAIKEEEAAIKEEKAAAAEAKKPKKNKKKATSKL